MAEKSGTTRKRRGITDRYPDRDVVLRQVLHNQAVIADALAVLLMRSPARSASSAVLLRRLDDITLWHRAEET